MNRSTLRIGVTAHDVPGRSLAVRILGVRRTLRRTISSWTVAPDHNGDLDTSASVPVPHMYLRMCVVASTSDSNPSCPPKRLVVKNVADLTQTDLDHAKEAAADTVWLTLPVPEAKAARSGRSARPSKT
jgi:hypothetical protein